MTTKLQWLGDGAGVWVLILTHNGKVLSRMGYLQAIQDKHGSPDGYAVFSGRSLDPLFLDADLSVDEAKLAAKLLIMAGGQSNG